MADFIQVVTTTPTKEHAEEIGRRLLDRRLAGCIQVAGPISSTYWWKGKLETAEEWYCVAKTSANLYPDVQAEILAVHKYDEPEILAIPVVFGSEGYLDWLAGTLK